MKTIHVSGYEPLLSKKPAGATIIIEGAPLPMPDLRRAAEWYELQAEMIVDALLDNLPQGTADRVLATLLHRKASLFRVGGTLAPR